MEIITLAAGVVGLAILAVMALAPLVADLPLPRRAAPHRTVDPSAAPLSGPRRGDRNGGAVARPATAHAA